MIAASILDRLPAPNLPPAIDPTRLDVESLKVVVRLRRSGYAAYLVGGCVRDLLVGAHPKDFDVATSAHPEQIRSVFRNSRLIGRRFRLAHVYTPEGHFTEVATFRSNPMTEPDGGDPGADLLLTDDNQFGTAQEDASRRDFTVNALFYDVAAGRVIDFVDGRKDLDARVIRTIGDPEVRLREDPVRGLRAARIAAKLGFSIDPATLAAMRRHADELPRCAPARVLDETLKLLRCGAARVAFDYLRDAGLLDVLLPPVAQALQAGGPRTEEAFQRALDALDVQVARSGSGVSDAVLLASILSFLPGATPSDGPDSDVSGDEARVDAGDESLSDEIVPVAIPTVEAVLDRLGQTARLPRRVADRVRVILACQSMFLEPPRRRRRKGGGAPGFVRTPHFDDAFLLFQVAARAGGRWGAVVEKWDERVRQVRGAGVVHAVAAAVVPAPELSSAAASVVSAVSSSVVQTEGASVTAVPAAEGSSEATPARSRTRRRRSGRSKTASSSDQPAVEGPPEETTERVGENPETVAS